MKTWGVCPGCDLKIRTSVHPERWVAGVRRVTLVLVSGHQATVTLCGKCAPCTPDELPRIWRECVEAMAKMPEPGAEGRASLTTAMFRYDVPLGPLFDEPYPPVAA